MWNALIRWSLGNRAAVLGLAALLLGWGAYTATRLPVDVLPDVNAPTVTVLTETHGMAPDEVETLVTVPIETALNGAPGLRRLRSSSGIGISVVWAEFEWDTEPYAARQVVTERLQGARGALPATVTAPILAPMSSIMGEILFLGLTGDPTVDPMDVRDFAEWELRRRLLGIGGVAQVTPIGGGLRQIQIVLDPGAMEATRIGHRQVIDALEGEMCLQDDSADLQRDRADDLHRRAHESFRAAATAYGDKAAGRGRALNSMSVVSLYFRDHDRAVEEAKSALTADFYGERYSALANLGWAYYHRGDKVEAMTELRQSIMLNPDFCVGRYRLAEVYLDFDMAQQALDEITTVITDERCPLQDARRVEGVAKLRLGDRVGAKDSFDACTALAPQSCLADECREFGVLAASDAMASAQ